MTPCPDPEALIVFSEGGADARLAAHLVGCDTCREILADLARAKPAPALPWRYAAAAALLLAVSGWVMLRERAIPTEVPVVPSLQTAAPDTLSVGGERRAPGTVWLGPGSRLKLEEGAVRRLGETRLAMEGGALWIEHLGALTLDTPAGTIMDAGTGAPCRARVRCAVLSKTAWWLRHAEAAGSTELTVEVHEGELRVRTPGTEQPLKVQAGERLRVAGAAVTEHFQVPPAEGLRVWQGAELTALLGSGPELGDGTWALPVPPAKAYLVEVRVKPLAEGSRVGLAVPSAGGVRLWQPSGTDVAPGAAHWLRFAVLGGGASGMVDGKPLWAVADLSRALQPVDGQPGLRVWGRVAVTELRIRVME